MDLLQLRYFYESAKNGSFAKTAEKHLVPTSSVSVTVKRLERELGCQLFDRHSNRIVLNEKGRMLSYALDNILNELDRVTAELMLEHTQAVEIKILASTLRSSVIAAIIEYRKLFPGVRFKTIFNEEVKNYADYDLIIAGDFETIPDFEAHILCKKQIHMTAASDSPLCGRALTIKQLKDEPFLVMTYTSTPYQRLLKKCEAVGFVPQIAMEINDVGYYNQCVEAGVGIGFTRGNVPPARRSIRFLNVTDFNEWITYRMFYKKRAPFAIQHFIDYLKSITF